MTEKIESSANLGQALHDTNDLPIAHHGDIHRGKVRSVYWLSEADSQRLIQQRGYDIHPDQKLGVMVISDRLSAFDCVWHAEGPLHGVPSKGACLNAIAAYWFDLLQREEGFAHHILEQPHPLVWIVQRTDALRFEAIARQYLTGSLWRAYQRGEREFGGVQLPDGMRAHQRLPQLLLTPTTKGTLHDIPGVPAQEDTPVTRAQILEHWRAFGLQRPEDLDQVESMLQTSFQRLSAHLQARGQLLVDTKFEFGYVRDAQGQSQLVLMDEVGTPDSSRLWQADAYAEDRLVEYCKESFRQHLLDTLDREILLRAERMPERLTLAQTHRVPVKAFLDLKQRYQSIATQITGHTPAPQQQPVDEIIEALRAYDLITSPPQSAQGV